MQKTIVYHQNVQNYFCKTLNKSTPTIKKGFKHWIIDILQSDATQYFES
jgi:hypothetical protein